jgi:hypothetical protein
MLRMFADTFRRARCLRPTQKQVYIDVLEPVLVRRTYSQSFVQQGDKVVVEMWGDFAECFDVAFIWELLESITCDVWH